MPLVEWTVSVGNIATVIAFLAGGAAFLFSMKADMRVFVERFAVIDMQINEVKDDVKEVKHELSAVSKAMIQVAVQSTRLDSMSERIATIDRRYDELRRINGQK